MIITRTFDFRKEDNIFEINAEVYVCRDKILYLFDRRNQTLAELHKDILPFVKDANIFGGIYMLYDGRGEVLLIDGDRRTNLSMIYRGVAFYKNMILNFSGNSADLYFVDSGRKVSLGECAEIYDEMYFAGNEIFAIYDDNMKLDIYDLNFKKTQMISRTETIMYSETIHLKNGYIYKQHSYSPLRIYHSGQSTKIDANYIIKIDHGDVTLIDDYHSRFEILKMNINTGVTKCIIYPAQEFGGWFRLLDTYFVRETLLTYKLQLKLPQDFSLFPQDIKELIIFLAMFLRRFHLDRFVSYKIIDYALPEESYAAAENFK